MPAPLREPVKPSLYMAEIRQDNALHTLAHLWGDPDEASDREGRHPWTLVRAIMLTSLAMIAVCLVVHRSMADGQIRALQRHAAILSAADRQHAIGQRYAQQLFESRSTSATHRAGAPAHRARTRIAWTSSLEQLDRLLESRRGTGRDHDLQLQQHVEHVRQSASALMALGSVAGVPGGDRGGSASRVEHEIREQSGHHHALSTAARDAIVSAHRMRILRVRDQNDLADLLVIVLLVLVAGVMYEPAVRMMKRTHERWKVREAAYQRVARVSERTTNAVVITDTQRRIKWVNAGFTRISGYSLEEVIGRTPGELLQFEKTDQETIRRMREAFESERSFRGEILNRSKDGREYWLDIEIQPEFDDQGVLCGFMAVQSDITEILEAHQRAQRAIREISILIRALDEHSIMSVADASGKIVEVNTGFCRISGYTRDELVGQDHRVLNSGHHQKAFWVDVWRQIASGTAWRGEVCNRAKDGSEYWVDSTIVPYVDEFGRIEKYISIRFDITPRKLAEAEMMRAHEELDRLAGRLEVATEGAGVGIWDYDPAHDHLVWDATMHRIFGTDPVTVRPTYRIWRDAVHPEDRAPAVALLEEAIAGKKKFDTSFRIITPTGETKYIRAIASSVTDEGGTTQRMVGANWDISAQSSAIEAMRDAQRLGRLGSWTYHIREHRVEWSEQLFGLFARSTESGHPTFDEMAASFVDEDRARFRDAVNDAIQSGALQQMVLRTASGRDGTRYFKTEGRTRLDRDGSVVQLFGTFSDVTDAMERERTLERAIGEAQAANTAKSEFLANMSHEIRTPMTAILGYCDLISSDGALSHDLEGSAEAIRTIRRNANHLMTIINDILDMSKIEAGCMTVEHIPTHPARIVEEVASLLRPRAEGKGISLHVSYQTPIPEQIQSDPTRLRQILLNLAGNAIKFTEHGSVEIRVACAPAQERFSLEVIDTGIGMTPEQLDAIMCFDAFTQADNSVTRRFGGTGLGLRISNTLAEILGGSIAAESRRGVGSTFRVEVATGQLNGVPMLRPDQIGLMDLATQSQQKVQEHGHAQEAALASRRILLVEDGPDNQRLISFHLRKAGAEVAIAENGVIALEAIQAAAEPFHLVMMDMQMPEMDGYTATSILREHGNTIPIIALTAHAMDGDREKCLQAGCDDYLTKPVVRDDLIGACLKQLSARRQEAA